MSGQRKCTSGICVSRGSINMNTRCSLRSGSAEVVFLVEKMLTPLFIVHHEMWFPIGGDVVYTVSSITSHIYIYVVGEWRYVRYAEVRITESIRPIDHYSLLLSYNKHTLFSHLPPILSFSPPRNRNIIITSRMAGVEWVP